MIIHYLTVHDNRSSPVRHFVIGHNSTSDCDETILDLMNNYFCRTWLIDLSSRYNKCSASKMENKTGL